MFINFRLNMIKHSQNALFTIWLRIKSISYLERRQFFLRRRYIILHFHVRPTNFLNKFAKEYEQICRITSSDVIINVRKLVNDAF